jgi:site-specific recombinase XerD
MQDIMTKLGEDIRLRGLSKSTYESYLGNVRRYFDFLGDTPIESTSEADLRRYSAYLRDERRLAPKTLNTYLAAVIFLYEITLDRHLNRRQIPLMKVPRTLPRIFTRAELGALMDVTTNLKHRAIISLGYGSGLRVSEVCNLKVVDIDSTNMRLFVDKGKGDKDRYTILSEVSLLCLRKYWRAYRPRHPQGLLFAGHYNMQISVDACANALKEAMRKADIEPLGRSFHMLRHCFGTYLLEDGVDLMTIKCLMGHSSITSTTLYLHLADVGKGVKSPLDKTGRGQR